MDIQHMKDLWQSTEVEHISVGSIKQMTNEKSHPLLKKIKRQLLIEIAFWIAVLCFYYTAFDGQKRPLAINLVFVFGLIQAIFYNLASYLAAKNLINGSDLASSLSFYTQRLKKFRWILVVSRILLMVAILVFFSYGLELNIQRLISMVAIILVFAVQLVLLYKTWDKRINRLTSITISLCRSEQEKTVN